MDTNSDVNISSPNSNLLESTTILVLSVYRKVWAEFYDWESKYCRDSIDALSRPLPRFSASSGGSLVSISKDAQSLDTQTQDHVITIDDNSNCVEIYEYPIDSYSIGTTTKLPFDTFSVAPLAPFPPYESCTPATRNIFTGDDSPHMPFIPYADDATFNYEEHALEYKYFAWQSLVRDPDLESILTETARRLHFDHNIPFAHIDETGVLPKDLLPNGGESGLIHASHQRDYLRWPGSHFPKTSSSPLPRLRDLTEPKFLHASFPSLVADFCPNLNCIQGYCSVHHQIPKPNTVVPSASSVVLRSKVLSPCGEDCFILIPDSSISTFQELQWSQDDLYTLQTVLNVTPDTVPCDLATICRKPCREVYTQRQLLIPDQSIKPAKVQNKIRQPALRNANAIYFTPNAPCQHQGPCTARTRCPCHQKKSNCEKSCRCSVDCSRRWRGCDCSKLKSKIDFKICGTDNCPCFASHRECDPEVCLTCNAKEANVCQNASLQQGRRKETEVKNGAWGLGLFILEPTEKGDLIAEYTGEIIYEPTTLSRDDLAKHRQRNYLFGINSTISIDSTYAGNETRFVNHDRLMANAFPEVWLVNGEHRIGIYALTTLQPGTEVFIDYGASFFEDTTKEGDLSEPSCPTPHPTPVTTELQYGTPAESEGSEYRNSQTATQPHADSDLEDAEADRTPIRSRLRRTRNALLYDEIGNS